MKDIIGQTDKIYEAIRKTWGYGDEADELVEALSEMAEAWEDKQEEEQ